MKKSSNQRSETQEGANMQVVSGQVEDERCEYFREAILKLTYYVLKKTVVILSQKYCDKSNSFFSSKSNFPKLKLEGPGCPGFYYY